MSIGLCFSNARNLTELAYEQMNAWKEIFESGC